MIKTCRLFLILYICLCGIALAEDFLDVGDYEYTINGKSAVPIMYGVSSTKYYDLTIAKDNIYNAAILEYPNKDFSLSATMDGKNFVCSGDKTKAKVSILRDKDSVTLKITSRLISPVDQSFLDGEKILKISGSDLKSMGLD